MEMNTFDIWKADLKTFGLNPDQWKLEQMGKNLCLLINRQDRKFTLWGQTRRQGQALRLRNLQLRSI